MQAAYSSITLSLQRFPLTLNLMSAFRHVLAGWFIYIVQAKMTQKVTAKSGSVEWWQACIHVSILDIFCLIDIDAVLSQK